MTDLTYFWLLYTLFMNCYGSHRALFTKFFTPGKIRKSSSSLDDWLDWLIPTNHWTCYLKCKLTWELKIWWMRAIVFLNSLIALQEVKFVTIFFHFKLLKMSIDTLIYLFIHLFLTWDEKFNLLHENKPEYMN